MTGFWTRFEQGNFVRFERIGDLVEGLVVDLGTTNFGGKGDTAPTVKLQGRDGTVRELAADKVNLLRQLSAIAPERGDYLGVRYDGDGPKEPGKNPPKQFTVVHMPASYLQAGHQPPPFPPIPPGLNPPAGQAAPPPNGNGWGQQAPAPQAPPPGWGQAPPPAPAPAPAYAQAPAGPPPGYAQAPQAAPPAPPAQAWPQAPQGPAPAPQAPPPPQGAPLPPGWPATPRPEQGPATPQDAPVPPAWGGPPLPDAADEPF